MGEVDPERLLLLLREVGVVCSYGSAQQGVVVSEVGGHPVRPAAVTHLPCDSPPTVDALDDESVKALFGVRDPHVAAVDLLSIHLLEILQTRPVEGARLEIQRDGAVVVTPEREPVTHLALVEEPVVIYAPTSQEYYSAGPAGESIKSKSKPQGQAPAVLTMDVGEGWSELDARRTSEWGAAA